MTKKLRDENNKLISCGKYLRYATVCDEYAEGYDNDGFKRCKKHGGIYKEDEW